VNPTPDDTAMRLERIERSLAERVAQGREALAMQREALEAQRAALAESRELVALQKANVERAAEVNRQAAQVSRGARMFLLVLLPVVIVLIGYVSWLLFFKLGLR
jgi:hypothetical protein